MATNQDKRQTLSQEEAAKQNNWQKQLAMMMMLENSNPAVVGGYFFGNKVLKPFVDGLLAKWFPPKEVGQEDNPSPPISEADRHQNSMNIAGEYFAKQLQPYGNTEVGDFSNFSNIFPNLEKPRPFAESMGSLLKY